MRAVAYQKSLPINQDDALLDIELPKPIATGRDLLISVKAIAVNPVDTKVRKRSQPADGEYKILGWDVAGIVEAIGEEVSLFNVGDEVYYAGDITRPGANAEFHLVDERIVGKKPATLTFEQAAALPLTTLTAWETLFDRLKLNDMVPGGHQHILIIGGAGGVGSIAIQLIKKLTNYKVIATASRPETQHWVKELGADHVLDHHQSLIEQFATQQIPVPDMVFSTTHTDQYITDIATLMVPQGRLALIDDPQTLNIAPFKQKSISIHWEFMYTRSMFNTVDMAVQGHILNQLAALIDEGEICSTQSAHFGVINASNLKKAHTLLESNQSIGKIVLAGF